MKQKRQRADSVASAVHTFATAEAKILPPAHIHLRDRDLPFWQSIVRARAVSHWTDTDLENAANLARCKSDIEKLQAEIDAEGDTIENARGTMVVNPKHTLLETLSRRMVALSRMLHVHAEATSGKSRGEKETTENQASARETLKKSDDDLIPRVSH